MTKDVFDEYGNYKYPDYSNSQYTNYATATGGKMGMTIEELVAENDKLKRQLAYESTALTMMKADYKARLKADMVAMLDEIDLELAEQQADFIGADDYNESYGVQVSRNVIREKINALKAERDEKGEE